MPNLKLKTRMLEISTRSVSGGEDPCANRVGVLHVHANHKTRRPDLCRLFRHPCRVSQEIRAGTATRRSAGRGAVTCNRRRSRLAVGPYGYATPPKAGRHLLSELMFPWRSSDVHLAHK